MDGFLKERNGYLNLQQKLIDLQRSFLDNSVPKVKQIKFVQM